MEGLDNCICPKESMVAMCVARMGDESTKLELHVLMSK